MRADRKQNINTPNCMLNALSTEPPVKRIPGRKKKKKEKKKEEEEEEEEEEEY